MVPYQTNATAVSGNNWLVTTNTSGTTATQTLNFQINQFTNQWNQTNNVAVADDPNVRYQAPPLEFNPYVNASDLLESFIRYVGELGVKQEEVLKLPISLFVNWLVIEASTQDGEPVPKGVRVSVPMQRCLDCGRFLPRRHRVLSVNFCGAQHAERYMEVRRIAA